jgi:hypothetical protein
MGNAPFLGANRNASIRKFIRHDRGEEIASNRKQETIYLGYIKCVCLSFSSPLQSRGFPPRLGLSIGYSSGYEIHALAIFKDIGEIVRNKS